MLKKLMLALTPAVLNAPVLWAEVPRVVTDIPPVHSLVSQVMEGAGTPDLLIRSGASAHSYSLRPSEAALLEHADLIFWVGPELTPWLEKPIRVLAGTAEAFELLEADGTATIPFREGESFGSHEDEDQNAHDHAHEGLDPHAWLDPENGKIWLDAIAENLAEADPENADVYLRNAEQAKGELDKISKSIDGALAPIRSVNFIVSHDAYQYFEVRFGLAAAGAIASGDAAEPGPARIASVRDILSDANVRCVLIEPQVRPGLVETVRNGSDARIATVDPAGTGLSPGPGLYSELLTALASALVECMS